MIGQIAGALTNIILDYVFIYPLNMGVDGAAYATVIGQCVSLLLDMIFHFAYNKELSNQIRNLKLNKDVIKGIFSIGVPAMIMQALLSAMMFITNMVLSTSNNAEILQATFSIYYKIQQLAVFASFGLSNALITLTSFNYGKKDKKRLNDIIRYGLIDSLIVSAIIIILFEVLALPISNLFNLAGGERNEEVASTCVFAIRFASIGFVFMSLSISIQGILQGLREIFSPLLISFLRLVIFIVPLEFLFLNIGDSSHLFWIAFPICELLTSICSFFILKGAKHHKINNLA